MVKKSRKEGRKDAVKTFIDSPPMFYFMVKKEAPGLDPILMTYPCSTCGKPIIFTRKDSKEVIEEIKNAMRIKFDNRYHEWCKKPETRYTY
jgi:DNA-directed RNA polymerase subunit RPC12/RpoP